MILVLNGCFLNSCWWFDSTRFHHQKRSQSKVNKEKSPHTPNRVRLAKNGQKWPESSLGAGEMLGTGFLSFSEAKFALDAR